MLTITHTFVSAQADGPNPALVKASNWNASHSVTGNLTENVNTVTYSATPNFDLSSGNVQVITLTGNVSGSTVTNLQTGAVIKFVIIQDSTGGRSFVWPLNVYGTVNVSLGGASQHVVQTFVSYDGVSLYAAGIGVII